MSDEELGKLVAQGVNLGNQHGIVSKEFSAFLVENKDVPELLELLDTAFFQEWSEKKFDEEENFYKFVHLLMMSQIATVILGIVCYWVWKYYL